MNPKLLLLALGLALLGTSEASVLPSRWNFLPSSPPDMAVFTCRLDYAIAPKALANIIGLATGAKQVWLDPATGTARTNANYDGLTFQPRDLRVYDPGRLPPNAPGTDGPGNAFPDEFNASAGRAHRHRGVGNGQFGAGLKRFHSTSSPSRRPRT